MKRVLYYLFFLVSIFCYGLKVDASNKINSIDMDIHQMVVHLVEDLDKKVIDKITFMY